MENHHPFSPLDGGCVWVVPSLFDVSSHWGGREKQKKKGVRYSMFLIEWIAFNLKTNVHFSIFFYSDTHAITSYTWLVDKIMQLHMLKHAQCLYLDLYHSMNEWTKMNRNVFRAHTESWPERTGTGNKARGGLNRSQLRLILVEKAYIT